MTKKKAFIFWGGWDGHEPELVSARFQRMLEDENFEVVREDNLDRLEDLDFLKSCDLIVPEWTQGDLDDWKCFPVTDAVESGV